MSTHVHGADYHRPDDRGRCTHTCRSFGCLVQCDSPDIVGTGLCIDHLRTADVVTFESRVITTTGSGAAAPTTGATP